MNVSMKPPFSMTPPSSSSRLDEASEKNKYHKIDQSCKDVQTIAIKIKGKAPETSNSQDALDLTELKSKIKVLKKEVKLLEESEEKLLQKQKELLEKNPEKFELLKKNFTLALQQIQLKKIEGAQKIILLKEQKHELQNLAITEKQAAEIENQYQGSQLKETELADQQLSNAQVFGSREEIELDKKVTQAIQSISFKEEAEKQVERLFTFVERKDGKGVDVIQFKKPTEEEDVVHAHLRLIDERKFIYADQDRGALQLPPGITMPFKVGDSIPLKDADGNIIDHMKINHLHEMSEQEYNDFKETFKTYIIVSWVNAQKANIPGDQKAERHADHSKSEQGSSSSWRRTHRTEEKNIVDASELINKTLSKYIRKTEGLKEEKLAKNLAALERQKEKIQRHDRIIHEIIIKTFIEEWNEKLANLNFDEKSTALINEIQNKYDINLDDLKIEEVRIILINVLAIVDSRSLIINKKIEVTKKWLEKTQGQRKTL